MSDNPTFFDRLGGIRPTAALLGEPVSTVASWKKMGRIPAHKQPGVLRKLEECGIPISAEDVVFPLGKGLFGASH